MPLNEHAPYKRGVVRPEMPFAKIFELAKTVYTKTLPTNVTTSGQMAHDETYGNESQLKTHACIHICSHNSYLVDVESLQSGQPTKVRIKLCTALSNVDSKRGSCPWHPSAPGSFSENGQLQLFVQLDAKQAFPLVLSAKLPFSHEYNLTQKLKDLVSCVLRKIVVNID